MRRSPGPAYQRGAASLVVVMVLLFIVALAAAYTGRSMIFEQRTSANQYAAAQAFEAAEAGLEWAIAMLNGGRIDDLCQATTDPTQPSFRQRYLAMSPADGAMTVLPDSACPLAAGFLTAPPTPQCVLDPGVAPGDAPQWRCECPRDPGALALAPPASTATAPAFRVRLVCDPVRPDVVRLESNGCTRLDDACLRFDPAPQAAAGSAIARVSVLLALKSALTTPPIAAVTAGGRIDLAAGAITAVNGNPSAHGLTAHAGLGIDDVLSVGPPGTPPDDTRAAGDASLRRPALGAVLTTSADRLFATVFGLAPDLYLDQPALVRLTCADVPSPCDDAGLRAAVAANPGRIIRVAGDLDVDTAADVGTPDEPVLLVVEGNLTFSANARLNGFVYARTSDWITDGNGRIHGAAMAEGDISGSGSPIVTYDPAILARLRLTQGSFVRVPGSWRDFQ